MLHATLGDGRASVHEREQPDLQPAVQPMRFFFMFVRGCAREDVREGDCECMGRCASASLLTAKFPRVGDCLRSLLPVRVALAGDPVTRLGIALKIAVPVVIPPLEELKERIAKGGVHADCLARVVAAHAVACETFLKECLVVRAATVELTSGGHARWKGATFSTGVVPGA